MEDLPLVTRALILAGAVLLLFVAVAVTWVALRVDELRRRPSAASAQPCRRLHAADLPPSLFRIPVGPELRRVVRERDVDEEEVNPTIKVGVRRSPPPGQT